MTFKLLENIINSTWSSWIRRSVHKFLSIRHYKYLLYPLKVILDYSDPTLVRLVLAINYSIRKPSTLITSRDRLSRKSENRFSQITSFNHVFSCCTSLGFNKSFPSEGSCEITGCESDVTSSSIFQLQTAIKTYGTYFWKLNSLDSSLKVEYDEIWRLNDVTFCCIRTPSTWRLQGPLSLVYMTDKLYSIIYS